MVLTRKQEEGLRIAVERFRLGMPYTCIAGYAGSGKSTLVRFIIEALDIPPEQVCYVAFTGKAATVLQQKGCPGAITAHKLLYKAKPMPNGSYKFVPNKYLEEDYQVIVVDEVSMLPATMWALLISHGIYVLACGDPGQLPPVNPEDTNDILERPHVFLDEIMRQAQESEIIRLTMDIRAGKPLQLFKGNEVQIIDKSELVDGMLLWADQIICAKNETRRNINQLIRQYKYGADVGFAPVNGDKVICLRNDWDRPNLNGDVMVNGMIGTITNIQYGIPNQWLETDLIADVIPDGYEEDDMFASFDDLHIDYKLLTSGEPTVNKKNFKRFPPVIKPKEFDYGYCITCHKSQGSEYDKVLVFEEFLRGGDHARWLYTACTRAKKKLVIVRA